MSTVQATQFSAVQIDRTPMAIQALWGTYLKGSGTNDFSAHARSIFGLCVFDQRRANRYILCGVNSTGANSVGLHPDDVVVIGENSQTLPPVLPRRPEFSCCSPPPISRALGRRPCLAGDTQ